MNLYDFIFKRKSTRKYDMTPLTDGQLAEIKAFADNLKTLYKDIKVEYTIANDEDVKNILPVKAPHYFVISSEKKDGYLTNVGFMFQQMDLFLSSKGLGTCWLGMAKPNKKISTKLEFVIILAFGKALDSPYREFSEFKRKALSEISTGTDERLEVARLAPSATNSQNWFFAAENGKIHTYQKRVNPIMALVYDKINKIDMGIAICHLYFATEHLGKNFIFSKEAKPKEMKGYTYIGTVE